MLGSEQAETGRNHWRNQHFERGWSVEGNLRNGWLGASETGNLTPVTRRNEERSDAEQDGAQKTVSRNKESEEICESKQENEGCLGRNKPKQVETIGDTAI